MKSLFTVIAILNFMITSAQKNIFHLRDYWKTNPSVEKIKKDILKGNDPVQLNSYGFDAVVYSLLENVNEMSIKYLLEIDGNTVDKRTHDSRTYIFWAAYKGNIKIMNYLFEKGAKINIYDSKGNSPITFAAVTGQRSEEVYNLFEKNGTILREEKNKEGANILLLISPFLKNLDDLESYYLKGFTLNDSDKKGNNIFNYSSTKGNIEFLETLVKEGVNPNINDKDGRNAFFFACQGMRNHSNSLELYKYLESLGIKVNKSSENGFTPLHALAFNNKEADIFNYFIKKGLNVNQQDIDGNTPFLNAAYSNDLASIKLLSKHVDNINLSNKSGLTALMLSVNGNSPDIVKFLLINGSDPFSIDINGNNIAFYLLESYKERNKDLINEKLVLLNTYGFEIDDTPQGGGNSLIHLAVKKGDLNLVKWLEQFKLKINLKNNEGYTALHLAAMKSKDDRILKYLLTKGADKTIETDFGEIVIDLAGENELLEKNKINLNFLK